MRSLLVADDDAHIRELLRYVMTKEGYRVYEAQDGVEAVQWMEKTEIDLASHRHP